MSHFATVNSSNLGGPDNPAGRFDAAYNIFVQRLRQGDDTVTSQSWTDLLPTREKTEHLGNLTQASTVQEIEATLIAGLRLDAAKISPALRAGFKRLADRIARERLAHMIRGLKAAEKQITALQDSLHV